jgi:hypothetical protein
MSTDAKTYLSVMGPKSVIQALAQQAPVEGVEIGPPQPADAMTDMVDTPLGPEEIKMLMEFSTVSLALGAAMLEFVKKLRDMLKKSENDKAPIVIFAGRTNAQIVSITRDSDPEQVTEIISAATQQ